MSTPDLSAGARPFRTWNGRDSWEFVDGVRLHAIGGEQLLLCRVEYAPGKQVPWHKHDDTEQVMFILDGEVEMTIEDDTTTLRPGDVNISCMPSSIASSLFSTTCLIASSTTTTS